MNRLFYITTGLGTVLLPLVAHAQDRGVLAILTAIHYVVDRAIPVVVSLALVVFLFGLVKFLASARDEDAIADGRRLMVYGIVALFVMTSVWGLVGIINQLSGISQGGRVNLPRL